VAMCSPISVGSDPLPSLIVAVDISLDPPIGAG
jgi:hypothetical protein